MKAFTSTALKVDAKGLWILDQTLLPQQEVWLHSSSVEVMLGIIQKLQVRGAPLIGVAAALQLGWQAEQGATVEELQVLAEQLRAARPTAVNLMNAMDRLQHALSVGGPLKLLQESQVLAEEDVELCARMARFGAELINTGERLLTHCNTGGLATAGVGTALGVILEAHRRGKDVQVYVDETRPLLQGARLTTWELKREGIAHTLICDNMAATLMSKGLVDRVLVGADRIALNGDFANKVGTYGLAVNAKFHGVPFYVVAPATTIDKKCLHGSAIPIELREPSEVCGVEGSFGSVEWAPAGTTVWNPAFDVTPEALVSAWILDQGVFTRADVKNGCLNF